MRGSSLSSGWSPGWSSGWSSGRVPRHGLPPRQFDALAAGRGGATAIAHLWDSERSHRLVLLGLLTTLAGERADTTGPLTAMDRAWDLLVAAETRSAAVTDELLLLPETGRWLRHTLLRLQVPRAADGRGGAEGPDEPPVWVDTGHLHLIAAAAAVRTGLDFTLTAPARAGEVWLPSLGCATLPDPAPPAWHAAELRYDGRTLTVRPAREPDAGAEPGADPGAGTADSTDPGAGQGAVDGEVRVVDPPGRPGPGWRVPRVLPVEIPDGPRQLFLHDLGPYRMQSAAGPTRQPAATDAAAARWTDLLRRAWPLLARVDPQAAEDVTGCLRSIEPLRPARPFRWHSATMEDGMGGMAASEPTGAEPAAAAQFAAILTHEVQHSKLSALLHMYSLHTTDAAHRLYAPWRDDPRPLRGMLHGVYAFTAVARFWRGYALGGSCPPHEEALAAFEFALRRSQLLRVLPQLRGEHGLTALGHRMVDRLLETVEQWKDEPVRADSLAWAEQAVEDHSVGWRLHHLIPDMDLVAGLARSWAAGPPAPGRPRPWHDYPAPRLLPDIGARYLDARAVLVRMRALPATTEQLRAALDDPESVVLGARPADLLLLDGDATAAQRLYTAEIAATPPNSRSTGGAWAGLRLALDSRPGHERAALALAVFPELVRDVYAAVRPAQGPDPDPVAVADWLGRTVAVKP